MLLVVLSRAGMVRGGGKEEPPSSRPPRVFEASSPSPSFLLPLPLSTTQLPMPRTARQPLYSTTKMAARPVPMDYSLKTYGGAPYLGDPFSNGLTLRARGRSREAILKDCRDVLLRSPEPDYASALTNNRRTPALPTLASIECRRRKGYDYTVTSQALTDKEYWRKVRLEMVQAYSTWSNDRKREEVEEVMIGNKRGCQRTRHPSCWSYQQDLRFICRDSSTGQVIGALPLLSTANPVTDSTLSLEFISSDLQYHSCSVGAIGLSL